MRSRIALTAAVLTALTWAGFATAGNRPHPLLDQISTEVAGKPLTVWCETNELDWGAYELRVGAVLYGFTYLSQPVTYLSPATCNTLHFAITYGYKEVGIIYLANAVTTLVHEAVHQRGISDERVAECTALPLVMPVMEKYLGLTRTVPELQTRVVTFTRAVRRKVRGRWVTVRVKSQKVVTETVQVDNPAYGRAQAWVTAWHNSLPAQYQGC